MKCLVKIPHPLWVPLLFLSFRPPQIEKICRFLLMIFTLTIHQSPNLPYPIQILSVWGFRGFGIWVFRRFTDLGISGWYGSDINKIWMRFGQSIDQIVRASPTSPNPQIPKSQNPQNPKSPNPKFHAYPIHIRSQSYRSGDLRSLDWGIVEFWDDMDQRWIGYEWIRYDYDINQILIASPTSHHPCCLCPSFLFK